MVEIGQKLWYVPSRRGEQYEVTVTKIGRKWITAGDSWREVRVDRAAMETNGRAAADGGQYSSPGTCYASREMYETLLAIGKAWSLFRNHNAIRYGECPSGVTVADIEQAMRLLKMGPPKC